MISDILLLIRQTTTTTTTTKKKALGYCRLVYTLHGMGLPISFLYVLQTPLVTQNYLQPAMEMNGPRAFPFLNHGYILCLKILLI